MTMTEDHKAALAEGREHGRIVRRYLELNETAKRRGRKRTLTTVTDRLAELTDETINSEPDPLKRLELTQERLDLIEERDNWQDPAAALERAEREFIGVAKAYCGKKGIGYTALRRCGVPARVLKEAKISRVS